MSRADDIREAAVRHQTMLVGWKCYEHRSDADADSNVHDQSVRLARSKVAQFKNNRDTCLAAHSSEWLLYLYFLAVFSAGCHTTRGLMLSPPVMLYNNANRPEAI